MKVLLSQEAVGESARLDLRAWDRLERPEACPELESERPTAQLCRGFSLLELVISLAILLIISGGVFALMAGHQKVAQSQELRADMYQGLRGATELMAQEIGQAGLVSLPSTQPTLSAAVTVNAAAQTVGVSSVSSMFVGEQLLVDNGTSEELVTLTAITASPAQITGIFGKAHAIGAVIKVLGVFPNGVMTSSTATELRIFGDIRSDGSLVYVHYDCSTAAGTLTRSITTVIPASAASNTPDTLLANLTANPGGTPCFQITTQSVVVSGTTYTFVTNVAITLSVRTSLVDPQTGGYVTLTKSLLNLAPRNVLIGLELANVPLTTRLQPTPPNLPLT